MTRKQRTGRWPARGWQLATLVCATLSVAAAACETETLLQAAVDAVTSGHPQEAVPLMARVAEARGRVAAFVRLSERLAAAGQQAAAREIALGNARVWLQEHAARDAADLLAPLVGQLGDTPTASAPLYALLGEAQLRSGRALSAVESLRAARAAGDRRAATRFNLASAWWESGRYAEAEEALRAGLEASHGGFAWQHQLGRLLLFLGRNQEASTSLAAAAASRPQAADVQLDLAWALDGLDRETAAERAYRRALELDPALTKARYGLARLLAREGKQAQARAAMAAFREHFAADRARESTAAQARARLDHGWDLLRSGHAQQAVTQFRALGSLREALEGLASALEATGDARGALAALERAVRLAPDDPRLRQRLAAARLAASRGGDAGNGG